MSARAADRRYGRRVAIRARRPPRHEWLPMLVGLVLIVAGAVLLMTRDDGLGLLALAPGVVLFFGVVIYRMRTATADD